MKLSETLNVMGLSWNFNRDDVVRAYQNLCNTVEDKQGLEEARDCLLLLTRSHETDVPTYEAEELRVNCEALERYTERMEIVSTDTKIGFESWFRKVNKQYGQPDFLWFHMNKTNRIDYYREWCARGASRAPPVWQDLVCRYYYRKAIYERAPSRSQMMPGKNRSVDKWVKRYLDKERNFFEKFFDEHFERAPLQCSVLNYEAFNKWKNLTDGLGFRCTRHWFSMSLYRMAMRKFDAIVEAGRLKGVKWRA